MRLQHRESIVLLLEGSRRAIPFNVVLGLLLALDLFYNRAPTLYILLWFSAIMFFSLVRWGYCSYIIKNGWRDKDTNLILTVFTLLTFCMGTIWGSCYWFMLPYINGLHEFIIILVFGGMCAGSIASLSVFIPAYFAYILPMFLPIIIYNYWFFNVDRAILATMFLLFVIMLIVSAKINNKLLNKTFQLSRENESLITNLRVLSITDPLTGLYNRRYFESVLQEELDRAKRNHYGIILVLLDIDDFKSINDNFGHPYGDKALIDIGNRLKSTFRRANDVVFRQGGDEFAVILANLPHEEAVSLCDSLNRQANKLITTCEEFRESAPGVKKLSLSMGLVSISMSYEGSYEEIIKVVDQALYQAKKEGKNRLIIAELG